MLFIGDLDNRGLSELLGKALGLTPLYPDLHVFPDGEMRVRILEEVADQEIVLLKSHTKPVDSNVLQTLFLLDALKRNGAGLITLIIPYFGYMRADHMFRTGEGVPLEVVIKIFEDTGAAKVLLLDPHSIKMPEMFHVPVINLSALELFAEVIKQKNLEHGSYTLVTPDMGGIRRIKVLSEMLGNAPYATIEKHRDLETGETEAANVDGKIHETVFIVDDMISSGGTIVKAIDALSEMGAKKIYVMATHPVLSKEAPQMLQNSKAEKIIVTDSLPLTEDKKFPKLEIVSVAPLLAKSLT